MILGLKLKRVLYCISCLEEFNSLWSEKQKDPKNKHADKSHLKQPKIVGHLSYGTLKSQHGS
jgi:hypothetical protein